MMKKDWIARELTMEIVVGAFMLMIFLGLCYFTIILSRETWFGVKYTREVVFSDVMGLREGDSVVVRGMPIGKIDSLELRDDGVHVVAVLDEEIHMRRDYKVTIVSTSILGGRYLEVSEGTKDEPELPEGTVLRGENPLDLMADAAEMINALKEGLVEGGIIDKIEKSAEQISEITTRVNKGEGTIGRLLSADDQLYEDLSASVASLREISGRLEEGEGTLGKLLSKDDQLYEDLSEGVASLRKVADRLERGEGLLGRLMQDDSLHDEIKNAIAEARAAIDDFRETSPIVTFTSVFFGAF